MRAMPKLEDYRLGDMVQYFNNALQLFPEEQATTLGLATQYSAFKTVVLQLNQEYKPNRGSQLTAKIDNLDSERDSLLSGLIGVINTYARYHFDSIKKEQAQALLYAIKKHGSRITTKRYQEETAIINGIVKDFTTDLTTNITNLQLQEWVDKLKITNTTFNNLYLERTEALSAEQKGMVAKLRENAIATYRTMIKVFDAFLILAEAQNSDNLSELNSISNKLSQLSEQYNEAILRGKSISGNTDNTNAEDTDTEDNNTEE